MTAGAASGPGAGVEALGLPHASGGIGSIPGAPLPDQMQDPSTGGDGSDAHSEMMSVLQQLVNTTKTSPGTMALFNFAQASDQAAATQAASGPSVMQSLRSYLSSPQSAAQQLPPPRRQLPYGSNTVPGAASPRDVKTLQGVSPGVPGAKLDLSKVNPNVWQAMSQMMPQGRQAEVPATMAHPEQGPAAPTQTAAAPGG